MKSLDLMRLNCVKPDRIAYGLAMTACLDMNLKNESIALFEEYEYYFPLGGMTRYHNEDVAILSILMAIYDKNGLFAGSLLLFDKFEKLNLVPSISAINNALRACVKTLELERIDEIVRATDIFGDEPYFFGRKKVLPLSETCNDVLKVKADKRIYSTLICAAGLTQTNGTLAFRLFQSAARTSTIIVDRTLYRVLIEACVACQDEKLTRAARELMQSNFGGMKLQETEYCEQPRAQISLPLAGGLGEEIMVTNNAPSGGQHSKSVRKLVSFIKDATAYQFNFNALPEKGALLYFKVFRK